MEQSVAVGKFVARIKSIYIERRLNREKQWPPCKSEKLVRLELVKGERSQGYFAGQTRGRNDKAVTRSSLPYSDILKAKDGRKTVRKVLVEGDAGIGKTTLCTTLSEDWANEMLFQEFEILLLLHLRQKRIASAGSLLDLLKLLYPSQKVCELVAEYIEEQEGKVLIIADGWDELSTEDRSEGSFLYELLIGECYSLSVVVTSRPYVSAPLRDLPCIDQFVEVHGFSKDDIKEFIQCEFANDKAKDRGLLEQLEGNPLIESVCSVPLNCAIVCHLRQHLEGALPTTMSELYTKIILNVVLRNIKKIAKYENIPSLPHFDALPESLRQPWSLLCEIAFQALSKGKIVFSHEDLSILQFWGFFMVKDILCFGLLQSAESILVDGHGVSFHFLHLTFQEYLAALYLVRQPPNQQLQLCWSHAGTKHSEMIWRFLLGISFTVYNQPISSYVSEMLVYAYQFDNYYTLTLCHFAFEANCRSMDILVTSRIGYLNFFARTAFDSAAVIHVIASLQDCSDIEIDLRDCGLGDKQIATLAAALAGEHRKLLVSLMDLSGNKLSDQSVADLFNKAMPAFRQSLFQIILKKNMIGPKAINLITTMLAKSLPHDHAYPVLFISDNPLGVDGVKALRDALCTNKLAYLRELSLAGSLTSDPDTNAEMILALGSGHCRNLNRLYLSRNHLGVSGGKALGMVLSHLSSVISLYLEETKLGDDGISALTQNVVGENELTDLQLKSNNIHAAGIACLAESVCVGSFSLSGDLANNPLGLDGMTSVVKIITSDHFLAKDIDLSGCQLTTAGGTCSAATKSGIVTNAIDVQQLIFSQQLQANNIYQLWIDSNNFSGERIHILAAFMYVCPSIRNLSCCSCEITSDDLKQLLVLFSELKLKLPDLLSWALIDNDIDDDGVSTLVGHLSMFPRLKSMDLHGNIQVSPGVLKTLKEKLDNSWKGNYLTSLDATVYSLRDGELTGGEDSGVLPHVEDSDTLKSEEAGAIAVTLKDVAKRTTTPSSIDMRKLEMGTRLCLFTYGIKSHYGSMPPPSKGATYMMDDEGVEQLHPTALNSEETTTTESDTCPESESRSKQEVVYLSTSSATATHVQRLDQVLDFEHGGVSKHLGQIADAMYEWEGPIAEQLELTRADVAAIKTEHPNKLRLQT